MLVNVIMVCFLARVFKIMKAFDQFKVLISSLFIILPAVTNVGCLILLIIFMFAIVGINIFPNIIF